MHTVCSCFLSEPPFFLIITLVLYSIIHSFKAQNVHCSMFLNPQCLTELIYFVNCISNYAVRNSDSTETNAGIAALHHPGRSRGRSEWPRAPSARSQEVWPDVYPMSLGTRLWWDVSNGMSATRKSHVEVCLDLLPVRKEESLKKRKKKKRKMQ